jgi:sulfate transport system substrate-binding protein
MDMIDSMHKSGTTSAVARAGAWRRRRILGLTVTSLASLAVLGACGNSSGGASSSGSNSGRSSGETAGAATTAAGATSGGAATSVAAATGKPVSGNINLVAYSTPQAAYQAIEKAFKATPEGKKVSFTESYGASGDQSRAVAAGQPADLVAFSLEPDITRLVKANMVSSDWNKDQYKGMVTDSVVVLAVRKGNPKNIKGWDDLDKPGIEVITPNVFQSGGAKWNIMAAYGAQLAAGKTEAQAVDYLKALFKNVPVQDDSARKSLQTFVGGKGDVMIAYENDAIFAQQNGAPLDYIVPDSTILIENPAAVTSNAKNPDAAKAFLSYLHTPAAQALYVKNGYRPVLPNIPGADKFPTPSGLFDISKFGGWSAVNTKFFDPKQSIMQQVEASIGVSSGA